MRFVKMQGIGNDFVVMDGFRNPEPADFAALSRRVCDRHFGIGADGLIWMAPAEHADARMRIFNADGSEAEMCGNGIRCAAKYLRDAGIALRDIMTIDTLAGPMTVALCGSDITVDMGRPVLAPEKIPVAAPTNRVKIDLDGVSTPFFCVSMGNPHAVTFDCFPRGDAFYRYGAMVERHELFPAKVNAEFCRVAGGGIDVRVWERGSGETLACGTGACAALTAASELGLTGREADVRLPGGTLHILRARDDHLFMTGPAQTVYAGEFFL